MVAHEALHRRQKYISSLLMEGSYPKKRNPHQETSTGQISSRTLHTLVAKD
jgi:hypothetical protein